jgi:hypothetical protein
MSKAAATLTYEKTLSHYRSLKHTAAMHEAAAIGLKIVSIAVSATGGAELTKKQWLKLSRSAERLEDLVSTRDFEG